MRLTRINQFLRITSLFASRRPGKGSAFRPELLSIPDGDEFARSVCSTRIEPGWRQPFVRQLPDRLVGMDMLVADENVLIARADDCSLVDIGLAASGLRATWVVPVGDPTCNHNLGLVLRDRGGRVEPLYIVTIGNRGLPQPFVVGLDGSFLLLAIVGRRDTQFPGEDAMPSANLDRAPAPDAASQELAQLSCREAVEAMKNAEQQSLRSRRLAEDARRRDTEAPEVVQ